MQKTMMNAALILSTMVVMTTGAHFAKAQTPAPAPAIAPVAAPAQTPDTATPAVPAGAATPAASPTTVSTNPVFLNIPPLKDVPISDADIQAKTKLFEDTPNGDRYLAYSVRLPNTWTKQESTLQATDTNKNLLGDIAHYDGPAALDARSYYEIQAIELGYEITAKNWFVNYALTHGYTLQGLNEDSNKRIESVFIYLDHDTSYVVRAVAEINGSRMILAMYFCPETHWKEDRAFQALSAKTFAFKNPEKTKIESTRTYAFLDLLRFDYPASWRLQAPNILSTESMSAKVVNSAKDAILNGQIDVNVVSTELDTTLPEQIKKVQKSLDDKGLVIGKLVEQPANFKVKSQVYYSRIEAYQANDKDKELVDYEYWIAVMIENRYYYIVTMLTPSRGTDFFVWARNNEAFRTVIESLRP